MQVWYLEGKGDTAHAALAALLPQLAALPGFAGAELLRSPAQPELSLLQSRWQGEVPGLPSPDGVRGWVFEVVAHVRAAEYRP